MHQAMTWLLPSSALFLFLSCAHAQPPPHVPAQALERFKADRGVKADAVLSLITIGLASKSISLSDGCAASLGGLTPVRAVTGGCTRDDHPVECPDSRIFRSDDGTLVQLDEIGAVKR